MNMLRSLHADTNPQVEDMAKARAETAVAAVMGADSRAADLEVREFCRRQNGLSKLK